MGARCCYGMKGGDSKTVVAHRMGVVVHRVGVVGWVWWFTGWAW